MQWSLKQYLLDALILLKSIRFSRYTIIGEISRWGYRSSLEVVQEERERDRCKICRGEVGTESERFRSRGVFEKEVCGNILTRSNGSPCDRCPFPRDYIVNCSLFAADMYRIDCGSPRFILTEARRLTANQSAANICSFSTVSWIFHDFSRSFAPIIVPRNNCR